MRPRPVSRSSRLTRARAATESPEHVVNRWIRDPVATLREAGLSPNDDDGVRLAALLAGRLRFERLVRGSGQVEAWFDEDPEGFVEAFRAYHAEVPPRDFFPADEARTFDAWLRAR